jgi:capsular polysaccharide transport system permease protein
VDFALFIAIGVIGFKHFIGTALHSSQAVAENKALLAYRQVLPVDTVLIRAVVEWMLLSTVTVVLLLGASLFGFKVLPGDPLKLIGVFGMLWLMGASFGLILAVVNTTSFEVAKIVGLAFMPLYLLSGVLYSPANIPPKFREILLYNPIVHGLELARGAFFTGYHIVNGVSAAYLAWWTFGALFIGLILHRGFENMIGAR